MEEESKQMSMDSYASALAFVLITWGKTFQMYHLILEPGKQNDQWVKLLGGKEIPRWLEMTWLPNALSPLSSLSA